MPGFLYFQSLWFNPGIISALSEPIRLLTHFSTPSKGLWALGKAHFSVSVTSRTLTKQKL
jgi:hypothetical protein